MRCLANGSYDYLVGGHSGIIRHNDNQNEALSARCLLSCSKVDSTNDFTAMVCCAIEFGSEVFSLSAGTFLGELIVER